MKKFWNVVAAIFSPWLLMPGLLFFKFVGFGVTLKHFYLMGGGCFLWTLVNLVWFLYAWKKSRSTQSKRNGT